MENSITIVGLSQNALVLHARALFEMRVEKYATILRAHEYQIRCLLISHISLTMMLQVAQALCKSFLAN
jgi:hypothetical protein